MNENESTYKIIRYYANRNSELVMRGLTLEEARAHCTNPETSSETCKKKENWERTIRFGPWFDGYTRESGSD